ncbi:hypothetical protein BFL34_02192 [Clavibacter michiganensis]|uniref:Uncharacterized protein n=1 Tax=Clavibacter michiganensis TaxID=28447 RepID=A0A251Y6X8_9MICO|nr:hypothetical protein [Clavibacter michiganensis]OUE20044.1 hypothetical protein BFL34_02192 [Clavibacter michiganensis]
MRKRIATIVLAATLVTGGTVLGAAPAQAAKLQWVTMQPSKALCASAVTWKLKEFANKGTKVYGTSPCHSTFQGWEGAIQYQG